jgi:hypothetical protein
MSLSTGKLSEIEAARLTELEAVIERGLGTFVEVGMAFLEVREARLYRGEFGTFEDYCRERWQLGRHRAFQLIDAARVVANVDHGQQILPANERQARPLSALPPEQQAEAWNRAVETAPDGKVTAAHVESVVAQRYAHPGNLRHSLAIQLSGASVEWYTPPHILTAVVACLGGIDLDPCAEKPTGENPNVPAARHFTAEDDGLCQPWRGRVFVNWPYGEQNDAWAQKVLAEFHSGGVSSAIALCRASVGTSWFRRFRDFPKCFTNGRLQFTRPDGNENSSTHDSALIYLGPDFPAFFRAFDKIGDIYRRVERVDT